MLHKYREWTFAGWNFFLFFRNSLTMEFYSQQTPTAKFAILIGLQVSARKIHIHKLVFNCAEEIFAGAKLQKTPCVYCVFCSGIPVTLLLAVYSNENPLTPIYDHIRIQLTRATICSG